MMTDPIVTPESRPEKRRVSIRYLTEGTVIKVHVRAASYLSMMDLKNRLETASRLDFSQSILVRRALDIYVAKTRRMDQEQLAAESAVLFASYR
jgi:hypothetical protein